MESGGPARQWLMVRELIDGTGGPPRRQAAVAVIDGRISEVCDQAAAQPGPNDTVHDFSASTLLPGLIDAHVHLVFDHGPDHAVTRAAVERASLPELTLRAARNAQMCLLAGITTARDCGDRGLVTLVVRDAIAGGLLTGPRLLAAGPPVTTTAGHLCWCGGVADTVAEARKQVRSLCASGVDLVKVMASGGNMTAGSNPLAPQYTTEELAAIVEEAHRLGRRVAAHSLNAESNRRAITAGVDTIEHCAWTNPDQTDGYDAEAVALLRQRTSWVVLTLAGIDRELLPGFAGAPTETAATDADAAGRLGHLSDRHRNVRRMLEAGVPVVIASDAGVRYSRFEDFWQSLAAAVSGLDLTPVAAIHRATQLAADALGLGAEIGSVTVGKRADLLLVDGDPRTTIADVGRVRQVWQGGRVVVQEGRLLGPREIPLVR